LHWFIGEKTCDEASSTTQSKSRIFGSDFLFEENLWIALILFFL